MRVVPRRAVRMNRSHFQQLAKDRLREAKALLDAKYWPGAYYLAGYAIECALKACILLHVERTGAIFQEKKYGEKCWTHDMKDLVVLAGLNPQLEAALVADTTLQENWNIARAWTEASRYIRTPKADAEELYEAIIDKKHGVFPWIKSRW